MIDTKKYMKDLRKALNARAIAAGLNWPLVIDGETGHGLRVTPKILIHPNWIVRGQGTRFMGCTICTQAIDPAFKDIQQNVNQTNAKYAAERAFQIICKFAEKLKVFQTKWEERVASYTKAAEWAGFVVTLASVTQGYDPYLVLASSKGPQVARLNLVTGRLSLDWEVPLHAKLNPFISYGNILVPVRQ